VQKTISRGTNINKATVRSQALDLSFDDIANLELGKRLSSGRLLLEGCSGRAIGVVGLVLGLDTIHGFNCGRNNLSDNLGGGLGISGYIGKKSGSTSARSAGTESSVKGDARDTCRARAHTYSVRDSAGSRAARDESCCNGKNLGQVMSQLVSHVVMPFMEQINPWQW
jgi:hypothetical protein